MAQRFKLLQWFAGVQRVYCVYSVYLYIEYASQTWTVANMTCRESSKARFENNAYQVIVFIHKAVGKSGQ